MISFIAPLLAALAAASPTHQDTTAIDRAVAAFTGRPLGAEGGARAAVDQRLRLAACPTLALSWRGAAGMEQRDAVVVTCTGPEWRIYVPVNIVPAAVEPRPAAAVGTRMAPPPKPEIVIKRGDPVMIEAGAAGFSITREGVAMGDAAAGNRFFVRVDNAKAPVQAIALENGRATLPGW